MESSSTLPISQPSVQIGSAADKALGLSDLASVAAKGCKVSVTETILSQMVSNKTGDLVDHREIENKCAEAASTSKPALPLIICRAAIAARLTSLSFGRCRVRETILTLMVDMLNENIVPVFTSPDIAGMELVLALTGSDTGKVYSGNGDEKVCYNYCQ